MKRYIACIIFALFILCGCGNQELIDELQASLEESQAKIVTLEAEAESLRAEIEDITNESKTEHEELERFKELYEESQLTVDSLNEEIKSLKAKPAATYKNTTSVAKSAAPTASYVGNRNTRKFHYSWCSSVSDMKEKNKYYYTGTRDGIVSQGYVACKRCNP